MPAGDRGPGGPASSRRRLGFFGAFHPMTDRAGAASTGMVLLIARSPNVERLVVFGPEGAAAPPGLGLATMEVRGAWSVDDPASLLRCLRAMVRASEGLDGFLFSIYPTFFGRRPAANGIGMLLPVLLRRLTGKPVVVFMHNFVESQDIAALGYDVPPSTVKAALWLERRLGRATTLVAGLASAAATVESELGVPVAYVPMRFVESVPGLLTAPPAPARAVDPGNPRILFFGTWGPQKDLAGALEALRPLAERPEGVHVTIAGTANPNFPEYAAGLERLRRELPTASFRFLGHVAEPDVPALFQSHDVLVLPYRTTGGYSGVMNVGGAYGIRIVAYDQPQLRECARLLDLAAEFVPAGDAEALRAALLRGSTNSPAAPRPPPLEEAKDGIERLLALFDPAPSPVSPTA